MCKLSVTERFAYKPFFWL